MALNKEIENIAKQMLVQYKDSSSSTSKLINQFVDLVVEGVTNNIVGEPYSYFDSTTRFYPSVTFFFREKGNKKDLRRTQIKLRLPILNEQVDSDLVNELRSQCESLIGLEYNHGPTRCYYVAPNKTCKTLLFVQSQEDAIVVLGKLLPVVRTSFDITDLSTTTGRLRKNDLARSTGLDDIPTNNVSYQDIFTVQFFRAVILVNGLRKPLVVV